MSRKLRIFISSTMKDLANERSAVVRRLGEFNFDPVNAENWGGTGETVWATIQREITSSDLFILTLGERYGWIPNEGPLAALKQSVTHLEYKEAQKLNIRVLPSWFQTFNATR